MDVWAVDRAEGAVANFQSFNRYAEARQVSGRYG